MILRNLAKPSGPLLRTDERMALVIEWCLDRCSNMSSSTSLCVWWVIITPLSNTAYLVRVFPWSIIKFNVSDFKYKYSHCHISIGEWKWFIYRCWSALTLYSIKEIVALITNKPCNLGSFNAFFNIVIRKLAFCLIDTWLYEKSSCCGRWSVYINHL